MRKDAVRWVVLAGVLGLVGGEAGGAPANAVAVFDLQLQDLPQMSSSVDKFTDYLVSAVTSARVQPPSAPARASAAQPSAAR